MTYYVDDNVFLYRVDKTSPYHSAGKTFLNNALKGACEITTSTESIQEIVHVSQRLNRLNEGMSISLLIIQHFPNLIPIDTNVISQYIQLIQRYPDAKSRDIIHLAACKVHKIKYVVTYDKDFLLFKEIKALQPENLE